MDSYIDKVLNKANSENESNTLVPIYICFTHSDHIINRTISFFTNGRWGHVGISFTPDLSKIYTFKYNIPNSKTGGIYVESLDEYKKGNKTDIAVYYAYIRKDKYITIKKTLKKYLTNDIPSRYSFMSILGMLINKPLESNVDMVCSTFTAYILTLADIATGKASYGSMDPNKLFKTIIKRRKVYNKLFIGKISKYNVNKLNVPLVQKM